MVSILWRFHCIKIQYRKLTIPIQENILRLDVPMSYTTAMKIFLDKKEHALHYYNYFKHTNGGSERITLYNDIKQFNSS